MQVIGDNEIVMYDPPGWGTDTILSLEEGDDFGLSFMAWPRLYDVRWDTEKNLDAPLPEFWFLDYLPPVSGSILIKEPLCIEWECTLTDKSGNGTASCRERHGFSFTEWAHPWQQN